MQHLLQGREQHDEQQGASDHQQDEHRVDEHACVRQVVDLVQLKGDVGVEEDALD